MFCHFYCSIDSTSGIDNLLRFERESVSEMGCRGLCIVGKVSVSQETVAYVTDIQFGIDFRISRVFGGLDSFFGGLLCGTEHGHGLVFIFNPCKYICQCQPQCVGGRSCRFLPLRIIVNAASKCLRACGQ